MSEVAVHLSKLPDEVSAEISHFTLDKVQPRVISFEEQVSNIRQHLAQIYERQEDWKKAANVLVGIPLETGQKYYDSMYICPSVKINTFSTALGHIQSIISWKLI